MSSTSEWDWVWEASASDAGPGSGASLQGRAIGPYVIEGELGHGGFGSVFKGFDPRLNRPVAIKVLVRAEGPDLQRFEREMQALTTLRHPRIVTVYDQGWHEGKRFLVMDYVPGTLLAERCQLEDRLPVADVVDLVADLARTIDHAHERGILHRDLKPSNILVDASGRGHVLDFGLSYLSESHEPRLSRTGAPLGTPAYMAPEQARGERPSAAVDVYGLGATLYHALTGRRPLEDASGPLEVAVHRYVPPSPRRYDKQIPEALARITLRCLAKEPGERFPTALALAEALESLAEAGPAAPRGSRKAIAATLLAIAVLVAGLAVWRGRAPASSQPKPGSVATNTTSQTAVDAEPAKAARAVALCEEAFAMARRRVPAEQVLAKLDRALLLAGDDPAARLRTLTDLAELRYVYGYREEAVRAAEEAQGLPGPPLLQRRARFWYAETLNAMGGQRERRGEAIYAELAREDPLGRYGRICKAILVAREQPAKALAEVEGILIEAPRFKAAAQLRVHMLVVLDRGAVALDAAQQLVQARPWDPSVYIALASAHGFLGNDQASLKAVNTAIGMWGSRCHALTYGLRAKIWFALRKLPEAQADLERALQGRPGHADLLLWRGLVYHARKKNALAYADWRQAHRNDPKKYERGLRSFPPNLVKLIERVVKRGK